MFPLEKAAEDDREIEVLDAIASRRLDIPALAKSKIIERYQLLHEKRKSAVPRTMAGE